MRHASSIASTAGLTAVSTTSSSMRTVSRAPSSSGTLITSQSGALQQLSTTVAPFSPNGGRRGLISSGNNPGLVTNGTFTEVPLDATSTMNSIVQEAIRCTSLEAFGQVDFASGVPPAVLSNVIATMTLLSEDIGFESTQHIAVAAVKELLCCDRATLFLVDHTSSELVFSPTGVLAASAVLRRNDSKAIRIPLASGIAGSCVTMRQIINISDAYLDPRFNRSVDVKTGYRTKSILSFPVVRQGQVIAVLQAINKSADLGEGGFSKNDELIAVLLGRQVGVQLHNAQLFDKLRMSSIATQHLMQTAKRLSKAAQDTSLHDLIMEVGECAKALLQSDRASLYLVDSKAQEMWTVVTSPTNHKEKLPIRLPLGKGVAGHVASRMTVMNVADAYECPVFNKDFDVRTGYRTRTILCLPMMNEGGNHILGVLQFINKVNGNRFDEDDEALAESFAEFASSAVLSSMEIETLRLGCDENALPVLPDGTLGRRIRFKVGWGFLRSKLRAIVDGTGMAFSYSHTTTQKS